MNTDFRLLVGYFEHPKIMKLQRRLDDSGVLAHIRLLRFASMNKPDGVLNGMDAEEIADAAMFKGDAESFVATLVSVRLLDVDEDGTYSLHDWIQHNPWAAGSKERSQKASKASLARRGIKVARDENSSNDELAELKQPFSSAPSPYPSPTPNPYPYPSPNPIPEDKCNSVAITPAKNVKSRLVSANPPTLQDAEAYFAELGAPDCAVSWHSYHTAGGWKQGRGPMLDWKASCRYWLSNDFSKAVRRSKVPPGKSYLNKRECEMTIEDIKAQTMDWISN